MQDLTVQLDDDVLETLGKMAAASGLTIEDECRRILHEWAAAEKLRYPWDAIDKVRASTRPQKTDSTDLIREDRDSR